MSTSNGDWHGGSEQTVEALGKTWRLGRQTRHVWREFAAWARTKLPDPLEAVAKHLDRLALADTAVMRELMRADQEEMAKHGLKAVLLAPTFVQLSETLTAKALDKASSYLSFGSPELLSLLANPEGQVRMLWILLLKHQPDCTEDDADDFCNALGFARLAALLRTAGGYTPEPPEKKAAPARGAGATAGAAATGGASTAASCASAA